MHPVKWIIYCWEKFARPSFLFHSFEQMLLICYSTFDCKLHLMAILLQKIHTSVMTASLDASRISEFFRAVCVCFKVCLSLKQGMYFIWVLSIVIEKDKHTHRRTKRIIWTVASLQSHIIKYKEFPSRNQCRIRVLEMTSP